MCFFYNGFSTNGWAFNTALYSEFDEHETDNSELNRITFGMQTTLLDSYPPTLREISWNTRREWSIDCDRKECRSNSRYHHWIRTNLELWSRILGSCQQRLRHCPHAKVWRCRLHIARSNLGGHIQVCGSSPQVNSINTSCQRIQDEEERHMSEIFICCTVVSLQCHLLKLKHFCFMRACIIYVRSPEYWSFIDEIQICCRPRHDIARFTHWHSFS